MTWLQNFVSSFRSDAIASHPALAPCTNWPSSSSSTVFGISKISADPIRHTEEGGDVVRQVGSAEEDVGIEINTFEWLLAHRMIFSDKEHIRSPPAYPLADGLRRAGKGRFLRC